jgi:hypothetical protein
VIDYINKIKKYKLYQLNKVEVNTKHLCIYALTDQELWFGHAKETHTKKLRNSNPLMSRITQGDCDSFNMHEKEGQATYKGLENSKPKAGAAMPFLHLNIVLKHQFPLLCRYPTPVTIMK